MNALIMQKFRREHAKGLPILVIIVGESGTGKTTFVKAMGCEENRFESSRATKEALSQRGEPINHDTIHAFAQKAYGENPYWQVSNILKALREKQFLILDGPRKIEEVKALIKEHSNTIVARIFASGDMRFKRLENRDKVNQKDFARIIKDENTETELNQILLLSDLTIENNGTIKDLQRKALEFKKFLQTLTSPGDPPAK